MPASRTMGFGTGDGTEGVVVSPELIKELEHPEQAIAEYLREIRDRYVLPGGMQPLPGQLAANRAQKFDFSQQTYNALLVTVTSGTLNIFFGDYTSIDGTVSALAHFVVSAAVAATSVQIALPPGPYIITVQATNAGTAVFCVTPMAL